MSLSSPKNTVHLPQCIRQSAALLHDVRSLIGCAMLTALHIIISSLKIALGPLLQISFGFLAVGICALEYGPVLCGISGVAADLITLLLRPDTGAYFPGFTFNALLGGILCGCFLYRQRITLWRVIACRAAVVITTNLILTPIWLHIMYGNALLSGIRIIKSVVMFPIEVALLYTVLNGASRLFAKRRK